MCESTARIQNYCLARNGSGIHDAGRCWPREPLDTCGYQAYNVCGSPVRQSERATVGQKAEKTKKSPCAQ